MKVWYVSCTMCLRKTSPFHIMNNYVKTESISVIFGMQYPEEISRQKIINSPTSLEYRRTTL